VEAQQEFTIEQLKEENTRLKAEISRLKSENQQLRKTVR
jgi:cell division protein FtsB